MNEEATTEDEKIKYGVLIDDGEGEIREELIDDGERETKEDKQ